MSDTTPAGATSEIAAVAKPTAVYLTTAPGSRVYVGSMGEIDDFNVHGEFIGFAPTGEVRPHPHALQQTYQVEGFAFVEDPKLIAEMDRLAHRGNVPFIRHPNPEIISGGTVSAGIPAGG